MAQRFADRSIDLRAVRALTPVSTRLRPNRASDFAARIATDRHIAMRVGGLRSQVSDLLGEVSRRTLGGRKLPAARRPSVDRPSQPQTTRRLIGSRPPFLPVSRPVALPQLDLAAPLSSMRLDPAQAPADAFDGLPEPTPRDETPPGPALGMPRKEANKEANIASTAAPAPSDYRRLGPTALRDTLRRRGGPGAAPDFLLRETLRGPLRFDPAHARLHRGPVAAEAARALSAQAFTIGRDVFFGEGRYEPTSNTGLELLAHELTHVGQQARLAGEQMRFFTASGGGAMEEEAQQTAARVRERVQAPRAFAQPVMQLAKPPGRDDALAGDSASSRATGDTVMEHATAPVRVSVHTVADHVYGLMKQELLHGRRRGQTYRKG